MSTQQNTGVVRAFWNLATSLLADGWKNLGRGWTWGEDWLLDAKRASYGLAVTRMLLATMFIGMTLTNFSTRLYSFGSGAAWTGQLDYPTSDFAHIWPVNLMPSIATDDALLTMGMLALIVCAALFGLGYRTRLIMIPLFILWVGLVEINEYISDQSDNLTRMIMIAMLFTAPSERWSFDARRRRRFADNPGNNFLVRWWRFQPVLPAWMTNAAHNFAIVVIACQICFIYASGGLYKAGGAPWSGGWAVYDPIHVEHFGPWPELSDFVTTWAPAVALATILTLLVQVTFPLLLLRRGTRIFALIVILGFHIGIAVLMGLPWFSLAMIAVDSIFIRDKTWNAMARRLRQTWDSARTPRSRVASDATDGGQRNDEASGGEAGSEEVPEAELAGVAASASATVGTR